MLFFESLELADLFLLGFGLDGGYAHDLVATVPAEGVQTGRTDDSMAARDHHDVDEVEAALQTQIVLDPPCFGQLSLYVPLDLLGEVLLLLPVLLVEDDLAG